MIVFSFLKITMCILRKLDLRIGSRYANLNSPKRHPGEFPNTTLLIIKVSVFIKKRLTLNSARIVHPWSKATKYWLTIICAVAICEERSMSHKFIPFSLTDKCVRFWCQDGAMLCAWVLTYESRLRHFQKNKVEGCKTNRFFSIVYSKVQFECFFLSFLKLLSHHSGHRDFLPAEFP